MDIDFAYLVSIGLLTQEPALKAAEPVVKLQHLHAYNLECCRRRTDIDAVMNAIACQINSGDLDVSNWKPFVDWQQQAPYRKTDHLSPSDVICCLAGKSKRALAMFLTDMRLSLDIVLPPALITPTCFNVYGCPDGDIIYVVALSDSLDTAEKVWQGQIALNDNKIRRELEILGYDMRRHTNVDLICINERGDISFCSSGVRGAEIQNWVVGTYGLHVQKYPCFLDCSTTLDVLAEARAVAKFVLDNWQLLIGEKMPMSKGSLRAALYGCGDCGKGDAWKRVDLAISGLEQIVVPGQCRLNEWLSHMKCLCTRVIQLVLLVGGEEVVYTVEDLVSKAAKFCKYLDGLTFILSRGRTGDPNAVLLAMRELWREYQRIVDACREGVTWSMRALSVEGMNNPTQLPDSVFFAILASPLQVPTALIDYIRQSTPDGEMPALPNLLLKSSDKSSIPFWLHDRIELCDQRDPEWRRLYRFYLCGRHSESIVQVEDVDSFAAKNYHLIRGMVMEIVLRDCVNYRDLLGIPSCYTASVGLLVKQKGIEGSPGCAPDLLVVVPSDDSATRQSDDHCEIIPVEMKCMREAFMENANYRREVGMATTQLRTCLDLLGRGTRGLLMMLWWDGEAWELRHSLIDFSSGGPPIGFRAVS